MSIPRVPIYIFCILRHHVTIIHVHFQWRTHLLTQVSLKTGVTGGEGDTTVEASVLCHPGESAVSSPILETDNLPFSRRRKNGTENQYSPRLLIFGYSMKMD